jgi:hypothetical protein
MQECFVFGNVNPIRRLRAVFVRGSCSSDMRCFSNIFVVDRFRKRQVSCPSLCGTASTVPADQIAVPRHP